MIMQFGTIRAGSLFKALIKGFIQFETFSFSKTIT